MAIRPLAVAPCRPVRRAGGACTFRTPFDAFSFPRDFSIGNRSAACRADRRLSGAPASAAAAAHKKVYLLRGLTNVLSPGIDQLNEELHRRNVDVTIANHAFSDSLAPEAIEGCKSGRFGSVVLVGHSLGASAAVSMAEQLQKGRPSRRADRNDRPRHQDRCARAMSICLRNYFLSSGVGTVVERGGHFHGTLQNVDMGKTDYGHVSLTTAPVDPESGDAGYPRRQFELPLKIRRSKRPCLAPVAIEELLFLSSVTTAGSRRPAKIYLPKIAGYFTPNCFVARPATKQFSRPRNHFPLFSQTSRNLH